MPPLRGSTQFPTYPGLAPRAHFAAAAARLIGHQHLAFVPQSDCDLSYDIDSSGAGFLDTSLQCRKQSALLTYTLNRKQNALLAHSEGPLYPNGIQQPR